MNYEQFTRRIQTSLARKAGKAYKVILSSTPRNNQLPGTTIHLVPAVPTSSSYLSPSIHLEPFYQMYQEGTSIKELTDMLYVRCMSSTPSVDCSLLMNWEYAKDRVYLRLRNTEKNEKLLKEMPHREFLDLSVTYFIRMDGSNLADTTLSCQVTNDQLNMWKITEDELFKQASANYHKLKGFMFASLSALLSFHIAEDVPSSPSDAPLYVLSYNSNIYGAACIIDEDILQETGRRLGSDFYLLPSSVHEFLVLPVTEHYDPTDLAELVCSTNQNVVREDEVLSDYVYRYDRDTKHIEIIA